MDSFMISFMVLIVGLFIVRVIGERSLKKLDPVEIQKVTSEFSGQRIWSMGFMIVIIGGYFLLIRSNIVSLATALTIYLVLLTTYFVGNYLYSMKLLNKIGVSDEYKKFYQFKTWVHDKCTF